MNLTDEERQELDTLFRLVDEAVVLRNQRTRWERELEHHKSRLAEISRDCEMAAMRIEQQRTKMTLAANGRRTLNSGSSRA